MADIIVMGIYQKHMEYLEYLILLLIILVKPTLQLVYGFQEVHWHVWQNNGFYLPFTDATSLIPLATTDQATVINHGTQQYQPDRVVARMT